VLYVLLLLGEVFHVWQAMTYLYTVSRLRESVPPALTYTPAVDVFITVAGEPRELVAETVHAVKRMEYPDFHVYLLNDGYVAGKDNWQDIEELAQEQGVGCITRRVGGGAKAGNINNAAAQTHSPYIAIFDADHVPRPHFLKRLMPYFANPRMGFVQTPQFYKNADLNETTRGAWEQQELFYGPICRGKNAFNAATMCGTNMILSRQALTVVGGMCTESIAEDFATGLFMHEKGFSSYYHGEVLAEGLAPEDFLSYSKQQFRWARGALDVLFKYNLLMRRGLTLGQKMQYLSSVTFFLSGIVVAFNMLLPTFFLYAGLMPLRISTMLLALVFVPYIALILYTLSRSSNGRFTFRALSFGVSGFSIQLQALGSALLQRHVTFAITPKQAVSGNYLRLVTPHIAYIALVFTAIPVAVLREGMTASVVNNVAWALFSIGVFTPFIRAAAPTNRVQETREPEAVPRQVLVQA
jgi:cellulose synthase (UDP-forming)